MANLTVKDGIWLVRFRFLGKEFKRSLKTRSRPDAEAAQRAVEWTIHRLCSGQLQLPPEIDVGDFIVSGGLLQKPLRTAPPAVFPSTKSLIDRYLENRQHTAAPTYHESQTIHLRHFSRFLGKLLEKPCNMITQQLVEQHLLQRLKIRDPETVKREKTTITHFYRWVGTRSDVPAFPCPAVGLPIFKSAVDRPPFRTVDEIKDILQRGGLNETQRLDLWECLFLSPTEIADLLATVQQSSHDPLSYLLHAVPAYTGMRRGELLRLQWLDIDFDHGYITATSRKQSRQKTFTKRQIDLHPELKAHLVDWQRQRAKGQLVFSENRGTEPILPNRANRLFWQPMRKTDWVLRGKRNWFKIGFHTYRHSFASNLAACGIDQRIIDEFMGHQTEEMRRRYRHLFPQTKRSAIVSFSLAVPTNGRSITSAANGNGVHEANIENDEGSKS